MRYENGEKEKVKLSTIEAAKYLCVGRGAIFQAIRFKKIPAEKVEGKWLISKLDLYKYKQNKYKTRKAIFEGSPIFDISNGKYSMQDAARFLNCPRQHLYHACRTNKIKHDRKYHYWVIHIDELIRYRDELFEKNNKKREKNLKKRVRNVLRNQRYCERCREKINEKVSSI